MYMGDNGDPIAKPSCLYMLELNWRYVVFTQNVKIFVEALIHSLREGSSSNLSQITDSLICGNLDDLAHNVQAHHPVGINRNIFDGFHKVGKVLYKEWKFTCLYVAYTYQEPSQWVTIPYLKSSDINQSYLLKPFIIFYDIK